MNKKAGLSLARPFCFYLDPRSTRDSYIYKFQAFAKAAKLRSYVFSAFGGKQQPGSCLLDK